MSIWFIQSHSNELRFIHYLENRGEGIPYYIKRLHEFKDKYHIKYGRHYAPHDIMVRELSSGRSRFELAQRMGINFQVVPNIGIQDGIEAVRVLFNRFWFQEENCRVGLDCIKEYHAEEDIRNRVYKTKPHHNWASHGCDALRYFAVGWQDNLYPGPPSVKYQKDNFLT